MPAAVPYAGTSVTQDFQSTTATILAPAAIANTTMFEVSGQPGGGTVDGWYVYQQLSGTPRWGRTDGSSSTGSFFVMYDSQATPNRALGSQGSAGIVGFFGTVLQNTSGATITSINLSYDAVINRNPAAAGIPNPYPMSYLTSATAPLAGTSGAGAGTFNDAAGTWTLGTGFTTPSTGTGAPGTQAPISPLFQIGGAPITQTLSSLNWAPNEYLYIRWKETDDTSSDATAGVDNVTVSPASGTAPTVTNVSPNTGSTGGGTSITITGTNFTGATGVTVGGVAATSVNVVNATTITATTPAGVAGTVDVRVTTPAGTSANVAADDFTYTAAAAPTVTSLTPNFGPIAGGTAITITGTNFTGATGATVGGVALTSFMVVNATTITGTTGAHAAGAVNVVVTGPGGSGTLNNGFTYDTAATVTSLTPNFGPIAGGTAVTITGTGFLSATGATIGGVALTSFTIVNDTTITGTTGAHAAGAVNVVVNSALGNGTLTNGFTYDTAATITSISPVFGPIAGGTAVTITGTGFLSATGATVGGVALTSFTIVNDTTITGTTGAHAAGAVNVVVNSALGNGTLTNGFTYDTTAGVTSITPNSGAPAGGTAVTITGTGFLSATGATVGGVALTSFTIVSDTSITGVTGAHAAGAVDVIVNSALGNGTLVGGYTYSTGATVTSVNPNFGPIAGGTAITITGTNFTGATGATVGGVALTSFMVVNATTITGTTGAHAAGAVNVVVNSPLGNGTLTNGFTYDTAATVTSIAPTSGTTAGGTAVTITGTGFLSATGATVGGVALTSFVIVSDTSITGVTGAHAAGATDVVVNSALGNGTLVGGYTYTAGAAITSVSPNFGPIAGGTAITITGTNFTGATGATVGGVALTSFTVVNATTITGTTGAHAAGAVNVVVNSPLGNGTLTNGFTYDTAATVTSIAPVSGPTIGGTAVTITGTGFLSATGATVGGVALTSFVIVSDTSITGVTGAHAAGAVNVVVNSALGNGTLTNGFTYNVIPVPTVTTVTPSSGPVTGGTAITITGTNFTGATAVTVGGTAATNIVVVNATTITATTPAHAAGTVDVIVTTPGGPSATSAADQFTFIPAPAVTSLSPTSGPVTGGTLITITGTNFTNATGVTVGGTAATAVTVVNATTITAITPAHGAGAVDVIVTTPSGTSPIVVGDQFTYVTAPTVTGVTPALGPVAGGTAITITGTNFTGVTAVTIGGVNVTGFTVVNSVTITATTPAHTAGLVDITVTSTGGTSATSAADRFKYVDAPTVAGINPNRGPTAGGTLITITGTALTGATAVTVGGVPATGVVIVNDTTITAVTPGGTVGTVDVVVTTPGGTSATSAADEFTYVAAPTVTSVTPNIGNASGGTPITISGTNFTGATAVQVGGIAATNIVIVDDSTITAVTPAHASGIVDVTVTSAGGTSALTAADKFTYDGSKPTVVISAPSATITSTAAVSYTVTYTDPNLNEITLSPADITLNRTGTANGTINVSGTGNTRTVTISSITGNGTLGIFIAAGTANDVVGNEAPAAGPSSTFLVDNIARFAVGDAGGAVRMLNAVTGNILNLVRPLDAPNSAYVGLTEVALGDFNGDGVADLAVSAADPVGVNGLAPSKAGQVFVYDGAALANNALSLIHTFVPFASHSGPDGTTGAYVNGLNIAVGDVNGDGKVDLIAGTRGGNGSTSGLVEYGRLVVIDGTSPAGSSVVIGNIQTPFGGTYQKGVVVAAGNVDGVGGDEIGVTRGGPVASPNPAVQQIKVKVLQLQGGALTELHLAADGSTALAPFGSLPNPTNAIARDGRVAFVDSNGDGKAELVFSALDPLTNPSIQRVRVGVYAIDPTVATGAATIISQGPTQGTYLKGTSVVDQAITYLAEPGMTQQLVLLVRTATTLDALYLAPLTGATQGGIALAVTTGGITIDGV